MFKRIKNFFKDIVNAFKKLFGVKKSDETVEVQEYTEITRNDEGEVISEKKVKVTNPNGTWRDLGRKFKNKVLEGCNKILDDPKKAIAWATASGLGIGAIFSTMDKFKRLFIKPIEERREKREQAKIIYDNYNSKYGRAQYELKRPLKGYEKNYINAECIKGRSMPDVLRELRVLA